MDQNTKTKIFSVSEYKATNCLKLYKPIQNQRSKRSSVFYLLEFQV